ncbi:MAG: DUF4493 domain-containing protein [Rikenellaceae bacterium]|nr:DUF4493 domain-containing protein [Rikenellaceae bacterium]
MKHLLKTLGLAAVAMAVVACTDNTEPTVGYGELRVSGAVSSNVSLKSVATADNTFTLAGVTLPESEQFSLELISAADDSTQSWATIAEFGSEKRYFPEGSYTLKAAYGDPTLEGFDIAPYFAGEEQITVTARKVTNAVITANIKHSLVAVECTDNFNNYFTSATFKVTTLAGGEFDIELPMSKLLFIRPQQFAIECTAIKQTGEEIALPLQIFTEVNPQTRYTVKFDVEQAGGATIEISLNDKVVNEVTIDNELNDDALPE